MADPNSFTCELKDEFKEWMDLPRFSKEYIDGVNFFLDFAFTIGEPDGEEILCPYAKCANSYWRTRDVVYKHLICKGFVVGYRKWINHGEGLSASGLDADMDVEDPCDDIDNLLNNRFRDVVQYDGFHEGANEDAKKFYKLVEEANQQLYPGCENFSTLSFTIRLYLLKCLHGWSNVSFISLLELLKKAIPNLNIPPSFNKTKAMIKDLGLDYEKIPTCPNDCMLYRGCYADKEFCHICGASRYIQYPSVDCEAESSKKPNVNAKILRHFPLIPRLQRMFMSSRTANTLRWHEDERSKDRKLRHPTDGQAWKDFDRHYPDFAKDSRNVRLGLASNGFNPYRTMSISHSTWPVVLMAYNLPPWLCMRPEYCMLSLLIPGRHSPGNDIDIYLEPLIEELKLLWDLGVETYDASPN